MTPRNWGLALAGVVLLFALLYGYSAYHQHLLKQDTIKEEQLKQLHAQDSTTRHAFDTINNHTDSVSAQAVAGINHWDTVTVRVPIVVKVPVPGKPGEVVTRVDSVYKDAAFAALPDSDKVKLLRAIGDKNARICTELRTSCQAARDSAKAVFVIKDREIDLWHSRFDSKPRRRCGLGFTVGIIGGVSSTMTPISGVGAAAGYSCSL